MYLSETSLFPLPKIHHLASEGPTKRRTAASVAIPLFMGFSCVPVGAASECGVQARRHALLPEVARGGREREIVVVRLQIQRGIAQLFYQFRAPVGGEPREEFAGVV